MGSDAKERVPNQEFNRNLIRLPLDYEGEPELAEIRVTLPSSIVPDAAGGNFDIGLQLVDKWGFHIPRQKATLELVLEGGAGEIPGTVEIQPDYDSHYRVRGRALEKDRVFRVRARDRLTGLETISNPAWLPDYQYYGDHKLFWGDLHSHRIETPIRKLSDPLLWSYGPATVHEYYQFARDVVHLDFAALTDHDYALRADDWRQIQEGAQYYNQPERFATFLGYEWAWNQGPDADHGHRHILFLNDNMPLVCASWHGCNTPQYLFEILGKLSRTGADILSIPHHSARLGNRIWHNWETMDSRFERCMEVFSHWGSSERQGEPYPLKGRNEPGQWAQPTKDYPPYEAVGHFLQDGLRLGRKFGFVGGSESHDGRAGSSVMLGKFPIKIPTFNYWAGLTGIWSRRKTRECLWSSLWNRRTIASTGVRIFVDFTIDNQPMGETIMVTERPSRLNVRVHGTGPLAEIVIVRNNKDWYKVEDPGWDSVFELDSLDMPANGTDWYYVRVVQQDGHMAWSSPVWVEDVR
ncbi:MAG: DUF3604 domain-containing protein [Armatimonadetes bacterium]|nr:DUF3604 domain-containing protein [Armatimonadota bacterium]